MLTRYLPEEQQRSLIAAAAQTHDPYAQRDAAWMRALLYSGCRITEFSLIDMRAAHYVLRARRLVIPAENRKGGARDHVILATVALVEAVGDLLRIREIITGRRNDTLDPTAPLIVNRYGERLSVRSYQKRVQHWTTVAGLTVSVSPHWLRHTRAHNIMRRSNAQDPRAIVQSQLGHASISSTGIYTQVAEHEARGALEAVDSRPVARKRDAIRAFRAGGLL